MENICSSSTNGNKNLGGKSADLDNFLKLIENNESFPVDSFSTFSGGNLSEDQDNSVTTSFNLIPDEPDSSTSSIHIFDTSQSPQSPEDNAESSGHSTNTVNDSNEAAGSQPNEAADGEEEEEEERQRRFVIHPSEPVKHVHIIFGRPIAVHCPLQRACMMSDPILKSILMFRSNALAVLERPEVARYQQPAAIDKSCLSSSTVIRFSTSRYTANGARVLHLNMPIHKEEPKAPVVPKVVITQPSSSNLMSTDLADSESTDSLPPAPN